MTDAKQLLSRSPLFEGASDRIIREFLSLAQPVHFATGEIPMAEATTDDRVFMVLDGALKISVELQAPDQDLKFLEAGPGTFIGLVNFFDAVSQPCTATAITAVDMLAWKAEDWRKLAAANPEFGLQLSQRIGRELVERLSNWINNLLNSVSWGL